MTAEHRSDTRLEGSATSTSRSRPLPGTGIMTDPPQRSTQWQRAEAYLGAEALCFLLQIEHGAQPEVGDTQRWDAVATIAGPDIAQLATSAEQQLSLRARLLMGVLPDGQTLFESLRSQIDVSDIAGTSDAVVNELARLVFNGLMLEHLEWARLDRFLISASFQDPALFNPIATAILEDPDLSPLFPELHDLDRRGCRVALGLLYWLPFGGGTADLRIVVGTLVEKTLAQMRFDGRLDQEHVLTYSRLCIEQLRRLARGEDVESLVLTGLRHIQVEGEIDRGWWGIKSAADLAVPAMLGLAGAEKVPSSVLWLRVRQTIVGRGRNDASQEEQSRLFQHYAPLATEATQAIQDNIETVRFAILSWAIENKVDINLSPTESWGQFPLGNMAPLLPSPASVTREPTSLTANDLSEIANVVDAIHPFNASLRIGRSRVLRVRSEGRDPMDGIIDAVIAWENVAGSKTETTFKVCAALAWLLEPDDVDRRSSVFTTAKRIYDVRSRVVHGDSETDEGKAAQLVPDAMEIAVKSMRRIHADPDLRAMNRSSARAERLIMRTGHTP